MFPILFVSFFSVFTSSVVMVLGDMTLLTAIITFYLLSFIALMILVGTGLVVRVVNTAGG